MSDAGRQSMTDKASAALKPDSQKSMTESMGDSVKGTADKMAGAVQPEGNKSATQQGGDAASGAGSTIGDMMDKGMDMLGMGKEKK